MHHILAARIVDEQAAKIRMPQPESREFQFFLYLQTSQIRCPQLAEQIIYTTVSLVTKVIG